MEKVKLPQTIAKALEEAKNEGHSVEHIAWRIPRSSYNSEPSYWAILFGYADQVGNFFKLIDALRYGYDIEDEPITVTITAEKQKEIRDLYKTLKEINHLLPDSETKIEIIERVLRILEIRIPGVNA